MWVNYVGIPQQGSWLGWLQYTVESIDITLRGKQLTSAVAISVPRSAVVGSGRRRRRCRYEQMTDTVVVMNINCPPDDDDKDCASET